MTTFKGKGYSIRLGDFGLHHLEGTSLDAKADFVCTNDINGPQFEPIHYELEDLPKDRVQYREGFHLSPTSTEISRLKENVELTQKIQAGVLSSKR
ncbi:hypothetical protein [Rhizobium skierniewicense]|uniref:hypothetical protein n=1 Tax=Rhizobium skierniewicense TaxID=984260 RepID=UPI001572B129|nr:hypothetical protein [Rhizobium skierniewicense]NTF31762.1 hypothetical protein [Rhizobium skierniewicense]